MREEEISHGYSMAICPEWSAKRSFRTWTWETYFIYDDNKHYTKITFNESNQIIWNTYQHFLESNFVKYNTSALINVLHFMKLHVLLEWITEHTRITRDLVCGQKSSSRWFFRQFHIPISADLSIKWGWRKRNETNLLDKFLDDFTETLQTIRHVSTAQRLVITKTLYTLYAPLSYVRFYFIFSLGLKTK